MTIPAHYHDYGPFDIPKKDKWLIVGTGPTADLMPRFLRDNPDFGVVSLNAGLAGMPYSTVHIVGHYEYFLQTIHHLHKPEVMFFANPCHVGFRCLPVMAINLLDLNFFAEKMGERLRFFEKESELDKLKFRAHTLYCRDSIASTALDLLSRNGVKEAFICGVDSTELSNKLGRAKIFADAYKVRSINGGLDYTQPNRFDFEKAAVWDVAKRVGIELTDMAETMAKDFELVDA